MASTKKIQKALTRLKTLERDKRMRVSHVVAMSNVFGALREYALKYGYKMRDLHEMNKFIRSTR